MRLVISSVISRPQLASVIIHLYVETQRRLTIQNDSDVTAETLSHRDFVTLWVVLDNLHKDEGSILAMSLPVVTSRVWRPPPPPSASMR